MALNLPDPKVTPTSNDKTLHSKTVLINSANFTTGGTASVLAMLPADASILEFTFWKKTQLSGGGITAATLSIGTPASPTFFTAAYDVFTPTALTFAVVSPVGNIMQNYSLPLGPDIVLQFTGTATTGNPTAGEMYVTIWYVR